MMGCCARAYLLALICLISITKTSVVSAGSSKAKCYEGLGCFPMTAPWRSALRPLPAPLDPTIISTKLYFYSRSSPQRYNITLWPTISLNGADFQANRQTTAFITHGFSANGNATWMADLKDKYLKRVDANVFLVDWGKGACLFNYMQVASNIRIVGAEVARFVKWLVDNKGLNVTSLHLMGHSLGAHTSSYIAKRISKETATNVSRLTAFDPAQPAFEGTPKEVRLDRDDADFVEILHTNSVPFIPLLGFGLMRPYGDVDFYINGGTHQPGCKSILTILKDLGKRIEEFKSIKDLFNYSVEEISTWVGCSHGRSYIYYTDALDTNCSLWGQKSSVARKLLNAGTTGFLEPLFASLHNCTEETCLPMGLETPLYKARGSFSVVTAKTSPYCNYNASNNEVLMRLRSTVLNAKKLYKSIGNKVKKFGNRFKSFWKKEDKH